MSNVYTMVPKKPAQYNILTKQERLVFVPLATTETPGIVKIGEGLGVSDGLIYIKPDILEKIDTDSTRINQLESNVLDLSDDVSNILTSVDSINSTLQDKVDVTYENTSSTILSLQKIFNDDTGLSLSSVRGSSGINYSSTLTTKLSLSDGILSYTKNIRDSGNISNHTSALKFINDGNYSYIEYNKTGYVYNGELATIPYVDNTSDILKDYVDDRITDIKKSVAYVFDTFEHFEQWLINSYERPDDATVDDLQLGDEIFIKEEGIPDYWVASTNKPFTLDNFVAYESGEALLFGNYYTKDEIDTLFEERVADVKIDESSITKNINGQIQTIGTIDQNTGNTNKEWTGTQAEYDAIVEIDPDTIYYITDVDKISLINDLSLYITGSVISSAKTFVKHVHIMLEFETDGVHGGTDFVLHPYDTSICFVTYDVLINGQLYSAQAYLDDGGYVRVNIPNGLTFTNVKGHYIEYGG